MRLVLYAAVAGALFGSWHVIAPVRQFYEGGSMAGIIANIALLAIAQMLSFVIGCSFFVKSHWYSQLILTFLQKK